MPLTTSEILSNSGGVEADNGRFFAGGAERMDGRGQETSR